MADDDAGKEAGPRRKGGDALVWYTARTSRLGNRSRRPLVCVMPWMWAQPVHVKKYVQFYLGLGCDVAVSYLPSTLAVWLPWLAKFHARRLLAALASELTVSGPRPLVFAVFSGASKAVYCPLLQLLADPAKDPAEATFVAATSDPSRKGAPGHVSLTQAHQV